MEWVYLSGEMKDGHLIRSAPSGRETGEGEGRCRFSLGRVSIRLLFPISLRPVEGGGSGDGGELVGGSRGGEGALFLPSSKVEK